MRRHDCLGAGVVLLVARAEILGRRRALRAERTELAQFAPARQDRLPEDDVVERVLSDFSLGEEILD